jgi:hypothetical protein
MLVISEISVIVPSQLLEDTYNKCSLSIMFVIILFISKLFLSIEILLLGNKLLSGINNIIMANIPKGILLFVSLTSSDTLILINIRINRNKIDTAPTYTNRYDIPMNTIPIKIK